MTGVDADRIVDQLNAASKITSSPRVRPDRRANPAQRLVVRNAVRVAPGVFNRLNHLALLRRTQMAAVSLDLAEGMVETLARREQAQNRPFAHAQRSTEPIDIRIARRVCSPLDHRAARHTLHPRSDLEQGR